MDKRKTANTNDGQGENCRLLSRKIGKLQTLMDDKRENFGQGLRTLGKNSDTEGGQEENCRNSWRTR